VLYNKLDLFEFIYLYKRYDWFQAAGARVARVRGPNGAASHPKGTFGHSLIVLISGFYF
jgi:hypothetical protein